MKLSEWRGQWTCFKGNKNTFPVGETAGDFDALCQNLAPSLGPKVAHDKGSVRYFLPTHLKMAPLVGKTRERALALGQPLEGKQRSASHVTTANMIAVDIDGVSGGEFKGYLRGLGDAGLSFLAYSSYSHGDPKKPGVRSRVVIPVDAPLDRNAYSSVAGGLAAVYFGGQTDKSGAVLCQQQGVWATNRAWKQKAFRIVSPGNVASSEQLMAANPAPQRAVKERMQNPFAAACEAVVFDEQRIRDALRWIDPEPHKTWVVAALYLKAAYDDESYDIWLEWTKTAPDEITIGNTDEYAPQTVWESIDPFLPQAAAAGALFAAARDAATETAQRAAKTQTWCQRSQDAVGYLMAHHNRFFRENFEVCACP